MPVGAVEDRPVDALADREVEAAGGTCEGNGDDLAALAQYGQGTVVAFAADGDDVGAEGFADPGAVPQRLTMTTLTVEPEPSTRTGRRTAGYVREPLTE